MKDTCVLLLALTSACLPNFDAIAQPILQALHETGPVGRRINVVFVAEGYTAPELEKFTNDAQRMASALLHTTPYSEYASFFNIFSLWVASEESGSDFPQFGVFKDTEFDSRFNCGGGLGQFICLSDEGGRRLLDMLDDVLPSYDLPVVLVNEEGQGGGAFGKIVTTSTGPYAAETALHELGHLFAGLADEYGGSGGGGRAGPNVTSTKARNAIPWRHHIAESTPLPTPATVDFTSTVGLFEGAAFSDTGWFRPQQFCKMRSLEGYNFCVVCREAHVRAIYRAVNPIESFAPVDTLLLVTTGSSLLFDLEILEPSKHTLEVNWSVDGHEVRSPASASSPSSPSSASFELLVGRALPETFEVEAVVVDPAPEARLATQHGARWTVQRSDFDEVPQPTVFAGKQLGQNFPNPARQTTTIEFLLTKASFVSLRVFDLVGREVATLVSGELPQGLNSVTWDLHDVTPGLYVYMLTAETFSETRQLVVL